MGIISFLTNLTVSSLAVAGGGQSANVQVQPVTLPQLQEEKSISVTVKKGDNLSKIAKKYKTSWQRIFDANKNIKHPDVINPGDKLRIPDEDEKIKHRDNSGTSVVVTKNTTKSYSSPKKSSHQSVGGNSVWDKLAQCESSGNWGINTGNGYYGGLQFSLATWRGVGGSGYPHQASREEQIARGKILQARSGWGQWPACASKLGLL